MQSIVETYRGIGRHYGLTPDGIVGAAALIVSLIVAAAVAAAVMHLQLPAGAHYY